MQTTPRLESQKARKSLKPKENRVKVNEDKTGLMILVDRKARRRLIVVNGGNMELTLAGKRIKTEERKKSLGLIVSLFVFVFPDYNIKSSFLQENRQTGTKFFLRQHRW